MNLVDVTELDQDPVAEMEGNGVVLTELLGIDFGFHR